MHDGSVAEAHKDVPVASFRGWHPAVTEMIKAASSPIRWGPFTVRPLMRPALPPARGSRRMVVAHVARNADALGNDLRYAVSHACNGIVVRPIYPAPGPNW